MKRADRSGEALPTTTDSTSPCHDWPYLGVEVLAFNVSKCSRSVRLMEAIGTRWQHGEAPSACRDLCHRESAKTSWMIAHCSGDRGKFSPILEVC